MGRSPAPRPFRQLTTLHVIIASIVVFVFGAVLMYLAGRNELWVGRRGFQSLATNLGSALVVSVALTGLWELVGKRSFAAEILEKAHTSTDVQAAGIIRMGMNYVDDADWDALFSGVQKLDIFVAYGRTWRNSHISRLRAVARTAGARIRVFLPDPDDPHTISVLASRFSMAEDSLKAAIHESRDAFLSLIEPGKAEIKVYFRKGDAVFSLYRFDSSAVVTLYTHSKARGQVPVFVCRSGGSMYDFARTELRAIEEQSRPAN